MNRKDMNRSAFTLVELLVVIVIISLVGGFLAPNLFKYIGKAKSDIVASKMAVVEEAVYRFQMDCGEFPESLTDLVVDPGTLDELLLNAAETFDEEADAAISRFMAVFPAVLILLLAVVVGFIIIATLLPMVTLQLGSIG